MSPEELLELGLARELIVIIIAALPILELRGAIPVAITLFHFPWYYAFLLAIIGNMLPVPLILLFLEGVSQWLSKIGLFRRMLEWLFERTRRRGKVIEKYQRIGLALFVAMPLPVTGAWTGSLAAVLFGLRLKHSLLSIFVGVLIAGVIITCLSLLGLTIVGMWQS
ncbi:COG2426 family protein [Chloroflexota bacterium]